jgi:NADPH-dependent 2,4-dienoyl-CoA reductase/sulfur reductase-like enzyme
VLPAERGNVGEQLVRQRLALGAKLCNGTAEVDGVPYDVAIVGSGFSGTMVAVHLARAQRGLRVALIDRSKTFARGVAYGTTDHKHLLNLPAESAGSSFR